MKKKNCSDSSGHVLGIKAYGRDKEKKIFLMLMTLDVWTKLDPLEFMLNKRKILSTPNLVSQDQFLLWNLICLLILSEAPEQTGHKNIIPYSTRILKDHRFLFLFL